MRQKEVIQRQQAFIFGVYYALCELAYTNTTGMLQICLRIMRTHAYKAVYSYRSFATVDHRSLRVTSIQDLNRDMKFQKVIELYERTNFTDSTERELCRRQYSHALTQQTMFEVTNKKPEGEKSAQKETEEQDSSAEKSLVYAQSVNAPAEQAESQNWKQVWTGTVAIGALALGVYLAYTALPNNNLFFDTRKHIVLAESSTTTFNDVKGADECREEVMHIVEFLRSPEKFHQIGARLPKGVLLTGEPGTGKTLLARAIAGEAKVKFFFSSGSDFEEMFVGLGAKRVRELFSEAKKFAPAIIFIDEIDALGSSRESKTPSYNRQSLNQLLVEMDGFLETDNIIVIGATNFPQSLDSALKRSGRFDKEIHISLPTFKGRTDILQLYLSKVFYDDTVKADALARLTPGMSGADLANLVNIAMLNAIKQGRNMCSSQDMDYAIDRVRMGVERKSLIMTLADKRATALHEAGHMLCGLLTARKAKLRKVTILARGASLGVTQFEDTQEKMNDFRKDVLYDLDVALGGRVAEELYLGVENVSAGCEHDLHNATMRLYDLVRGGMFQEFTGVINTQELDAADTGAQYQTKVDKAVRSIMDEAYVRAKAKLMKHYELLGKIAEELVEKETMTLKEVSDFIRSYSAREGKPIAEFYGLE